MIRKLSKGDFAAHRKDKMSEIVDDFTDLVSATPSLLKEELNRDHHYWWGGGSLEIGKEINVYKDPIVSEFRNVITVEDLEKGYVQKGQVFGTQLHKSHFFSLWLHKGHFLFQHKSLIDQHFDQSKNTKVYLFIVRTHYS
ncbi:hypothetical protein RCL1_004569 [Eukaryota sp. TZLM3-RCL]